MTCEPSSVFEHEIIKESNSFLFDGTIDLAQYRRADLDLSEQHNFDINLLKTIKDRLTRNNIIRYGIMYGEEAIPIDQTTGKVKIPIINKEQILEKISAMKNDDKKKIGYIHVSTIQLIFKSSFFEGIDSPVNLKISDDRLLNEHEALIAEGVGNLSCGKIKFDINVQIGFSIKDKNLEQAITLRYNLLRKNFMKNGNHPFSITYRINYALTNSHHSLSFKNKSKIEIDDLFQNVLRFDEIKPRMFSLAKQSSIKFLESPEKEKEEIVIKDSLEESKSLERLRSQINILSKRF